MGETRVIDTFDSLLNPPAEHMLVNMGPQHPSTHGLLRLLLEIDGETMVKVTPIIGYLHRGYEKLAENKTYNQYVTYTDRLDYLASFCMNLGFILAVEKLFPAGELEIPPRGQAIRVLLAELNRIQSHMLAVGAMAIDIGATTPFLYGFEQRELVYDLVEELNGSRMMATYARVGGLARDLPEGWVQHCRAFLDQLPAKIDELDHLMSDNLIFRSRTEGVGYMSVEDCLDYGVSGPTLRAAGCDYDVRKYEPYCGYAQYEFDVPTATTGDAFGRYAVRMEEMRQSRLIVQQALDHLPDGPISAASGRGAGYYGTAAVNTRNRKVVLPPKELVRTDMEAMIHHFLISSEGPEVPAGEAFMATEAPKGELAWFIKSKPSVPATIAEPQWYAASKESHGSTMPWRAHMRSPAFANCQAVPAMAEGSLLADIVAILGSVDIVMGEIDR